MKIVLVFKVFKIFEIKKIIIKKIKILDIKI